MANIYIDIGSEKTQVSDGIKTNTTPTCFDVYYGKVFAVESQVIATGKHGISLDSLKTEKMPLMRNGLISSRYEVELFLIYLVRNFGNLARPITAFVAETSLTASEKDVIQSGLQLGGVRNIVFVDWRTAVLAGLHKQIGSQKSCTVVDFGHGTCDFAMIDSSKKHSYSSIRLGGSNLCDVVEAYLRKEHAVVGHAPKLPLALRDSALSSRTDETLEIAVCYLATGPTRIKVSVQKIRELLLAALEPIATELEKMIGHAASPETILLTGGLSHLSEVSTWLQNRLQITVMTDEYSENTIIHGLINVQREQVKRSDDGEWNHDERASHTVEYIVGSVGT